MPDMRYASISARRTQMVLVSLLVAEVAGCLLLAAKGGVLAVGGVIATAFVSSLICARYLSIAIAEIRDDQARIVASLQLCEAVSDVYAEHDDIRIITSIDNIIIKTIESRQKERQHLLDQIIAAEEKLKLVIHNMIAVDNQEVACLRGAMIAMENMKNAFSKVIAEIDELSGRTEERVSISSEMSATSAAIAEKINQYSTFVFETSRSIDEMARVARKTAGNIRDLSISAEQTSSTIHLISASHRNVRENSERGAAASGSVRNQLQQGLNSMAATKQAMQEIVRSNDESFVSINRLSRYSMRVGEFLSIIQEVVQQTNLLSLNASIIAAQAGERGKAFAVVAEEIRSLAHRTSASTIEIKELVRNIQNETDAVQRSVSLGRDKVAEGVKISSLAHDALVTIDKSAEEASRMVAHIARETSEQSIGIQHLFEESEKNLERVLLITMASEQQQEGTNQILNNLERMRELVHRINFTNEEQAKGSHLYLKSVIDNDRTRSLKENASGYIIAVAQAVDAVQKVNTLIASNMADSMRIMDGVKTLTRLIDHYRTVTVPENDTIGGTHG
jgi:methyl-accepting chemotaxis protein